ncbi:MAG TPA: hypothetical protein VEK33_12015 [Terriglobales bacterium]|nr:hypothetical protein [Terriglobales bacterium]
MRVKTRSIIPAVIVLSAAVLSLQWLTGQETGGSGDNPDARPPVTKSDLEIVKRAGEILNSPSKWNRADTRVCPADANSFSLYCALERATYEVTGKFEHRGAAMQEARFLIDDIAPNRRNYHHLLKDYSNDPATTFADVQKFFRLLQDRIATRLKEESQSHNH